jgi:glycosyltransferase involved in cell wall biosynthesis
MFSIIIPLYNKAAYIEKAIYSLLSQTYQEFELIVVNDGSTDESLSNSQFIIHNLELKEPDKFKKIKIVQQENQGVSTARNNGVKLAKYDYIAFLDADDWWEPTYLEEMKGLIEEFPRAGLYGSSYYKVKGKQFIPAAIGLDKGFKRGIINYFEAYTRSLYQPIWTGAAIIKKSVFHSEKGFKPLLKMGEDFDLWVRVAMKYSVALLNKPLAYYNQDVELANRAIGEKLYEPEQHMLFNDYSAYQTNQEFVRMFETLAVYGLLPYYLANKNMKEVQAILKGIHWESHNFKYRLYYKILPKWIVRFWLGLLKVGVRVKKAVFSSEF